MASNSRAKRKYNIVFLIDGLGMGGAERMMLPILKNLSRDDFAPRVCVFQVRDGNPIADELRALGVPVDFLPVPYLRDISALPRLWKYLKDSKVDLVHTQLEFADTLGNIASKLLRLPSVSTVHTMPSQDMNAKSKRHHQVEWLALRLFCERVISVSEEARSYQLKISGIPKRKMITIYNGIDLAQYAEAGQERDSFRRELGIPLDAHLFTTVAVLREPKGIQFMLRALPAIFASDPNAYYLIAGDGPYGDALREQAGKIERADRVIFAGMRKDVPRVLAASDIFVLPTLTEALPTVLAEAMALRLPIIASAVGGVPEMVVDGDNGILLPAGDSAALASACISLMADEQRRTAMGERSWQVVTEKFDVTAQVESLKHLYLGLIEKYEK